MAALVALLRGCMESFKSILTSQDFGVEYELLCTEFSVQWLRIRLWGISVSRLLLSSLTLTHRQQAGLHVEDAHHLQTSWVDRHDVESTIHQIISSIAFLLTEIEALRLKYEFRPRLVPASLPELKPSRSSLGPFPGIRASSLRQRVRDNQKQKSCRAIAKWAVLDAKRFAGKVKRLTDLVDGLENVSKALLSTPVAPMRSPLHTLSLKRQLNKAVPSMLAHHQRG